MPPSTELLVELGTEEIPAGFLARALGWLEQEIAPAFAAARLEHGPISVWGTPRRIAISVTGLADRQPDHEQRVFGPPVGAAFDKEGKPTRAALGFAEKNGISPDALERAEQPGKKGEYLVGTVREPGRPARDVLPDVLTALLAKVPWPKSMRWGVPDVQFVRPVHWLVALFGGEVLPLSFAGVKAGRTSRGHRFLAPSAIQLDGTAAGYVAALRDAFVIVEPARRRTVIAAELARVEAEAGARVRPDDALLGEVCFLVEYPVAVCGTFPAAFLEVPEEVVVSAMRAHQRYFSMEDAAGKLANRFVTIAGTITKDEAVVRAGNERVLAARLSDAQFFFREDQKRSLDDLAAKLDGVVFQKKLGTIGQKVGRMRALAADVARFAGVDHGLVDRAAALAKADLVSSMVGEFPDLQGVMGRHYARLSGEPVEVCAAIEEHYLPRGAGGALPRGAHGAVVGIADRMDTLLGCWSVGLQPTGSADPYGLRRAALGVLAILGDRGWAIPLSWLVERAAALHSPAASDEVRAAVLEFLRTRLRGALSEAPDMAGDCVDAALAAGFDDVPDARARALALSRLRARADFEPLAAAFKRVANILKGEAAHGAPDPGAFVEAEEKGLWSSYKDIQERAETRLRDKDYAGALTILAELKAPVDRFFDKVLVMDKDERVKKNRLALLGSINATFTRIADFRQLAV